MGQGGGKIARRGRKGLRELGEGAGSGPDSQHRAILAIGAIQHIAVTVEPGQRSAFGMVDMNIPGNLISAKAFVDQVLKRLRPLTCQRRHRNGVVGALKPGSESLRFVFRQEIKLVVDGDDLVEMLVFKTQLAQGCQHIL